MKTQASAPEILLQAVTYVADPDRALEFMVAMRWPNGIICPDCAGTKQSFLKSRRIWKCMGCKRQFSVKVGTIFEDSPIGLDKWLPCLWMIANCKNAISSYEMARALGVTQKTAWFMLHRVRLAMQTETFGKMGGDVEADETFIGRLSRYMHHEKRKRIIKAHGVWGKAAVMGLLERTSPEKHSTVRVAATKTIKKAALQGNVRENVEAGANLYTDKMRSYEGLPRRAGVPIQQPEGQRRGTVRGCAPKRRRPSRHLQGSHQGRPPGNRNVDGAERRMDEGQDEPAGWP